MDRTSIFDFVSKLEQKYPVDTWAVDDIKIWPIIRVKLLSRLYGKGERASFYKSENNFLKRLFSTFAFKVKCWKAFFLGAKDYLALRKYFLMGVDVFFVSFVAHRQNVGGRYYNRFCDLMLEQAAMQKQKALLLEFKGSSSNYYYPRSHDNLVLPGDFAVQFFRKFFAKVSKSLNPSFDDYGIFLGEVKTQFGSKVSSELSIENVVKYSKEIDDHANFYSNLFQKSKPKVVFCVSYYSLQAQALLLCAFRLGIPSVDIQHGIHGRLHEAYGQWKKVPTEGYNLMPKYFWNWDVQAAKSVNEWTVNSRYHKSLIGGNPWLQYWERKKFSSIYQNSFNKTTFGRKIILYTLQPSFEPFPEVIRNAISKTKEEFLWLVRVHPRQMHRFDVIRTVVNELKTYGSVEMDQATMMPLPYLLSITAVHITVYSTVAIEAASYGVPTLFLSGLGKEYFGNELLGHLAHFDIETVDTLLEILNLIKDTKINVPSGENTDCVKMFSKLISGKIN